MKVQLKNVRPNPFRDMDAYPIHPKKIDQLKKSIASTDFWDNVVARKSATEPGCIEIAYGHHRLTALRDLYDGDAEFNWIVRDLDDSEMIKIMAHENLDEWGHDSGIERETVRAVVQALAEGKIALPSPNKQAPSHALRYAPSFIAGADDADGTSREFPRRYYAYTAATISAFLGTTLPQETVKDTLQALELIEAGHATEDQMAEMSSEKARAFVREVNRSLIAAKAIKKEAAREARNAPTETVAKQVEAEAEKKAKKVVVQTAAAVSTGLKGPKGSIAEGKQAGHRARVKEAPEAEKPGINKAAGTVATSIGRLLDPDRDPAKKLESILEFKQHLEPGAVRSLDRALERLIEDAEGYRARLPKVAQPDCVGEAS